MPQTSSGRDNSQITQSKKENRRVRYTKMMLRQSLLELLEQRPIEKITVADLCARADLNRTTFYNYYDSPRALLDQIEQELFEKIRETTDRSIDSLAQTGLTELLTEILTAARENMDLCRVLFGVHGDPGYIKALMMMVQEEMVDLWKEGSDVGEDTLRQLYLFAVGGAADLIQDWVQKEGQQSPRELAQLLDRIISRGVFGFLSASPLPAPPAECDASAEPLQPLCEESSRFVHTSGLTRAGEMDTIK